MTTQTAPQSETPQDELLAQARSVILLKQNPSVALLQRHLKIGYNRALSLMTMLEGDIVTAPDENGWRQMLDSGKRSPDDPLFDGMSTEQPMELHHYLQRHREPCPDWLRNFKKGDTFNRQDFFGSRVVYYPGSGSDGHAVRLFGSAHSAHCFVQVDYLFEQNQVKAELDGKCARQNTGSRPFRGYHNLARLSLSESDLAPTGWVQHVHNLERTRFSDCFKPYAFLEILERDDDFGDDHGSHRLAILFLGADGIASYDALFCQSNGTRPPFAVLIQEHGFGGNYDKFGSGGLLERIALECQVFPDFLLVADGSQPWRGYKKVNQLSGSVGGAACKSRFLHARTDRDLPDQHSFAA